MNLNIKTKNNSECFSRNRLSGFTFIEAMTVLFIFSVITLAFYSLISVGTRYIQDSKNRLGALAAANEKMEIVRNLQYNDIGTVNGEIEGNIPQNETIIENGRQYDVHTLVEYVDDSYDGTGYSDTVWFEDYKRVTIAVSWSGVNGESEEVNLVSRFVPPGLEVANPGDGILAVNVVSDQEGGAGVDGSAVHILNSDTGLNTQKQTDSSGNVMFMGSNVTDSIQKYEITVTKSGYETVSTLPPYPDSAFYPVDVHASVVTGSVNVTNIIQNKLADLKIAAVDYLDQSISGVNFHLEGGRKIGTEVGDPPQDSVYNTDTDGSTNSSGEKNFNDVSPGQYKFYLTSSAADYEIIATDPPSSYEIDKNGNKVYAASLSSEQSLTFKVKLAAKDAASLLVSVLNSDGDSPISGAQVNLKNDSGYDQTQTTSANGKAFFPTTSDPFQSGTYDLKVTAAGFGEDNSSVTVSDNMLKTQTVKLTAL